MKRKGFGVIETVVAIIVLATIIMCVKRPFF